ncbi:glycosyltransferase family 4 protein [Burkholderia vietnamiensis]|uniref:glycosyltransferase family 4 protein n=1 Tax=Burkholderia vietnamiensis TaxID=60552 RepID=UPI00158D9A2A|nr:glycosyltransferase family 4 protein [Burkholderia vietnamiensis]MBR8013145.1 glycosyltransferase family 4 protein [Burkholderia vietnamiensis]MCA7983609.1 glycosyltransferase family 4 protein [Burkholderia vietnamiensis]MDN8071312.1 glycosyltransferase family 4 protein [Burkholderia vietnamiensis]HDR8922941.1 glycosyltransferase family 4 protein [Burkholderia vietnamiensis]HDR8935217.1 glycosyltransferase family 4 protein [Burkholderia vietnamiensis]
MILIRRKLGWRQFLGFLAIRIARNLCLLVFRPLSFVARMRGRMQGQGTMVPDIVGHYQFVLAPPARGESARTTPARTVNWVIPDFGVGSGGHLNIFRFALALERAGFTCTIVIDGSSQFASGHDARESIRRHFVPLNAQVVIGAGNMPPAEFTFATSWHTAYSVRAFSDTRHRCYFVQDFEPYFYAHGSEYIFAENTYKWGLTGITAGNWLAEKLGKEYGMRTYPFGFSYDKALYANNGAPRPTDDRRRVFFYARPPTARRAFELGVLVLAEVAARHPEAEIVMAGWDLSGYSLPFNFRNAGILSLDALPPLFRSCDVALVLSYSNASLLPLELMACGCVVVSNDGPHVEWLLNDKVAKLVESDVGAMADAICELLEDTQQRQQFKEAGLEFCLQTDWEREGRLVSEYLAQLAENEHTANGQARKPL